LQAFLLLFVRNLTPNSGFEDCKQLVDCNNGVEREVKQKDEEQKVEEQKVTKTRVHGDPGCGLRVAGKQARRQTNRQAARQTSAYRLQARPNLKDQARELALNSW